MSKIYTIKLNAEMLALVLDACQTKLHNLKSESIDSDFQRCRDRASAELPIMEAAMTELTDGARCYLEESKA